METLYSQKIAILSRLIKESSLTLEEALLLLKEEQLPIVNIPFQQPIPSVPPFPLIPGDYWYTTSGTSNTNVSQTLTN